MHWTNVRQRGNFGQSCWMCSLDWHCRRAHAQMHTGKTGERVPRLRTGQRSSTTRAPQADGWLYAHMDSFTHTCVHTHTHKNPGKDSGKEQRTTSLCCFDESLLNDLFLHRKCKKKTNIKNIKTHTI